MPRLKSADKLEALRRQQTEIAAKLKEAEAADREQRKEQDRKRQELAGRAAITILEQRPDSEAAKILRDALGSQIKRAADRALFPELVVPVPAAKHAPEPSLDQNAA